MTSCSHPHCPLTPVVRYRGEQWCPEHSLTYVWLLPAREWKQIEEAHA